MSKHMKTEITRLENGKLVLSLELDLAGTVLAQEELLAAGLNELGMKGTNEILSSKDTSGDSIEVSGVRYTSKKKKRVKS